MSRKYTYNRRIQKRTSISPLGFLNYALFELTGQKLFEIYSFFVKNPFLSKKLRQVFIEPKKIKKSNNL